jgi:hypothetical protein
MRRISKEIISGIALIGSFAGMIILIQLGSQSYSNAYGVAILLFILMAFVSMFALVSFSRTGWRIAGSRAEWNLAIGMNPSGLIFWNRDYKEQVENAGNKDQARDEEYYRNRRD